MRIFDKEEIDPPSVAGFFCDTVLRILLFREHVEGNSMGGPWAHLVPFTRFTAPRLLRGRSNQQ